jgi:hypothetical protein
MPLFAEEQSPRPPGRTCAGCLQQAFAGFAPESEVVRSRTRRSEGSADVLAPPERRLDLELQVDGRSSTARLQTKH